MKILIYLFIFIFSFSTLHSAEKNKRGEDVVKEVIFKSYNGLDWYHMYFLYDSDKNLRKVIIEYSKNKNRIKEIYEKKENKVSLTLYENGKLNNNVSINFFFNGDIVNKIIIKEKSEDFISFANLEYKNNNLQTIEYENNFYDSKNVFQICWNKNIIERDILTTYEKNDTIKGGAKYCYFFDDSFYNNTNLNLNYFVGVGLSNFLTKNYCYSTEWFGNVSKIIPYSDESLYKYKRSMNKVIRVNGKIYKIILVRKYLSPYTDYGEYEFIY